MTLTVPCERGKTLTVTIYYAERGLAVQRHEPVDRWDSVGWGVVHLQSGRLVVHCVLATRQQARECQAELLALDIDWTHQATGRWQQAAWRLAEPVVERWEGQVP
jgi:hypothetical protein